MLLRSFNDMKQANKMIIDRYHTMHIDTHKRAKRTHILTFIHTPTYIHTYIHSSAHPRTDTRTCTFTRTHRGR